MEPQKILGSAAIALAVAAGLSACASVKPPSPLQAASEGVGAKEPSIEGLNAVPGTGMHTAASGRWWLALQDQQLNVLVEEAEVRNRDVRTRLFSVEEARAIFSERRWDYFPRGGLAAGISRQRLSGPDVDPFDGNFRGPTRRLAQADLATTWEIDLFGRNRARRDIAEGALDAAGADLRASRALLQAEVVSAWAQWRATAEQRRRLDDEIAEAEAALTVQEQRIAAGVDDPRAIHGPAGWLAERRVLRAETEARHAAARSALAVLRGLSPTADILPEPSPMALPAPPSLDTLDESPGLLTRRPDVARAEAAYKQAAGASVLADRAILPDFRVDVGGGVIQRPGGLDLSSAGRWAAAGIVQWNPLEWSRLRAQSRAAGARADAAFAALEATIVAAIKDAEDRIQDAAASADAVVQTSVTSDHAKRNFGATRARHAAGLEGRLAVVEARLLMGERDRALVEAKAASIEAFARAHLALATWQPGDDSALTIR